MRRDHMHGYGSCIQVNRKTFHECLGDVGMAQAQKNQLNKHKSFTIHTPHLPAPWNKYPPIHHTSLTAITTSANIVNIYIPLCDGSPRMSEMKEVEVGNYVLSVGYIIDTNKAMIYYMQSPFLSVYTTYKAMLSSEDINDMRLDTECYKYLQLTRKPFMTSLCVIDVVMRCMVESLKCTLVLFAHDPISSSAYPVCYDHQHSFALLVTQIFTQYGRMPSRLLWCGCQNSRQISNLWTNSNATRTRTQVERITRRCRVAMGIIDRIKEDFYQRICVEVSAKLKFS